jgi:hypothetical protein
MSDDAPTPALETAEQRRQRHAIQLRRLSEINMLAAELAAEELTRPADAAAAPTKAARSSATLNLARATRAVIQIIAMENRILDPKPDARARPRVTRADPRRALLREPLHACVQAEPDRAQLRRMIDGRLDEELESDPDHQRSPLDIINNIADEFGLKIDPVQLSDEILGIKPPPRPAVGHDGTRPSLWAPMYIPDPEPDDKT